MFFTATKTMPSTSKVRTKAELKYFEDDTIDVLPNHSDQQTQE